MDAQNPNPHLQSMRVLIRPPTPTPDPPPPPPSPPPPPDPSPSTTPSSTPSPQNGVVVVGFVGKRHGDVTQLINRIIDANVFGSGNFDTPFRFEKKEFMSEEIEEWFKSRSISFFYEQENGILYLQFSSLSCPIFEGVMESQLGFDSVLEDREFGDLQGLLFMFSVCHVLIFIQEGSHFDTQILKKFRVLQAAKHAMSSYFKSHITQPLTSSSHAPSSSRMYLSGASSNSPSPGRNRSILNRGAAAVSLMSGIGSYSLLSPGQCNPVFLFVFLDDFSNANPSPPMGEQVEASSLSQSSSSNNMSKPNFPAKGSGSVVVLARPVSKPEGGFRKKLQSSLEAQIRFSIKKCRILSSSETGHAGSRSGGISSSAPLFLLDTSKAVTLVDLCSNRRGESLEFATHLVEDVIDGKATSDSLLLENNSQSTIKEDILSVKEFVLRQADILRGRGGAVANTSSGPAAGVGMVAVAAAAAAASAASVKTFSTPELPSLETWLSSSRSILHGILSVKPGYTDESEISKRKPQRGDVVMSAVEGNTSKATESLELAVCCLENGRGLCSKFSTLWCEKALPIAKGLYLNDLPPSYPTLQHEAHLERALLAFKSMVKGPAVQIYMKKLENECTSIWCSGRQLCDAVSLTGKPCMHKRHNVGTDGLLSTNEIKPHSSGYVFLHACACGRSRQLRSDPFDIESANVTFNCFPECDKLLPAPQFPQGSVRGPVKPSCWSLIRVGSARYYNPAKGLLQSGFGTTQKFLLRWTIFPGKQRMSNGSPLSDLPQVHFNKLSGSNKDESLAGKVTKNVDDTLVTTQQMQNEVEVQKRQSLVNIKTGDKKISSGIRISSSIMRKPFSEVVAGSAGTHSGFPPLQTRKQPLTGTEKGIKPHDTKDKGLLKVMETANDQGSEKVPNIAAIDQTPNGVATITNACTDGDQLLQTGNNVVPVNRDSGGMVKEFNPLKHVTIYIGFEHECPHGHRFILRPDHLKDLGSPYAMPEESLVPSSIEKSYHNAGDSFKSGKNGGHARMRKQSNGIINSAVRTTRNLEESKPRSTNKDFHNNGQMKASNLFREQQISEAKVASSVMDLGGGFQSVSLDDDGSAVSLLNRNLPVYMNCPHCKDSRKKKDATNVKFAGTISQMQRIFLVTPPFPVILAACPVVQFEHSCVPSTVPDCKQKLQFSLGCQVILPPESFLSLRLPFVYGIELEDGKLHSLTPFEDQPQLTAWITKGSTLQVVSQGRNLDEGSLT
ncbi:hypothetical protein ACH5RR_021037 [Cinchona calisaya]|uniref:Nonsense-mediated mRNA decay factor SMG8 n=1 Tax=Cinchona calisaya TaxID=153742 RepID=A0ABD2ZL54_9GENT